jgi:flagellar L-ring protein precursor FlgH
MYRLHKAGRHPFFQALIGLPFLLMVSSGAGAQAAKKQTAVQASLDQYLKSVRVLGAEEPHTMGSLWAPSSAVGLAATDYKARHAGDLLIIRVADNFSATTNGTTQAQRTFSASSSATGLFGLPAVSRWQGLLSPSSDQNLNGKGQSALASTLSLNLAGRVVEALPNGVLVVEAARDLTVGNDRQTIVLRGLVRPGDIAADNSVSSTSIGNLEAEIRGKGVVADAIQRPNIAVRVFLRILGF